MILLEITGAVDAAGRTQTYYLSSAAFTTRPGDTPPDQSFQARLTDPGAISLSIYSGGSGAIAGGSSKLDIGEIVATNIDGAYDDLKNVSFDGREIVMRVAERVGGAYPADYPAFLVATMESVDVGWGELIVKVRDQTYVFEKPILTERFRGDNALPNGLEGTPDDIKDHLKPELFGAVQNIAPPCVNTSLQTYRVNNGPVDSIGPVWIRGAEQTFAVDYATAAALQAATVAQGAYATCLAEGLFRLGSGGADGQVTCNAAEGEGQGRSAARLLRRLAVMAGTSEANIDADDVAVLDALNPAPLGRWLNNEETSFLDVMDEMARSVGAWYGFDPTSTLRMGRLDAPRGDPVATLQLHQIIDSGMQRTVPAELPVPVWSVTINHTRIGQTQDTDLVGSVSAVRRAFLRNEYRSATSADEAVKAQWRLAQSLTIDTLLQDAAAAAAEAERVRALRGGPADVFEVPVPMDEAAALLRKGLWFGKELAIAVPRFDMAAGRSFVVIGINIQRRAQQVVFRLWAPAAAPTIHYADGEGYALISLRGPAVGQDASGPVETAGTAQARISATAVGQAVTDDSGSDETGEPVGIAPLTITKD